MCVSESNVVVLVSPSGSEARGFEYPAGIKESELHCNYLLDLNGTCLLLSNQGRILWGQCYDHYFR
jgi:hypothetical protein